MNVAVLLTDSTPSNLKHTVVTYSRLCYNDCYACHFCDGGCQIGTEWSISKHERKLWSSNAAFIFTVSKIRSGMTTHESRPLTWSSSLSFETKELMSAVFPELWNSVNSAWSDLVIPIPGTNSWWGIYGQTLCSSIGQYPMTHLISQRDHVLSESEAPRGRTIWKRWWCVSRTVWWRASLKTAPASWTTVRKQNTPDANRQSWEEFCQCMCPHVLCFLTQSCCCQAPT